ncbi:CopD family protein [Duganella sp. Dugasp56]|uniref:CopD family protein n=1 Tax=Duganella sp. Dugasp56 TaxID=3243046 RepID=UPI0039AFD47F
MLYLLLKTLHIAAVIAWLGGMLAVVLGPLSFVRDVSEHGRTPLLDRVPQWERYVTTPAMLIVWVAGITLTTTGHWFPQIWLMAKLVLVFLLSALHGILIGRLRKISQRRAPKEIKNSHHLAAGIILIASVIVALVVLKPLR